MLSSDLSFDSMENLIYLKNNLPLVSTSSSSIMHHKIKVFTNLNIDFIVIVLHRIQSQTINVEGILVLNSDPDSNFCPGCAEQTQNLFWNEPRIKSPQYENLGNISCNAPSMLCLWLQYCVFLLTSLVIPLTLSTIWCDLTYRLQWYHYFNLIWAH